MCEWDDAIQKMIDWIENNLEEETSLLAMSKQIGYSPFYCSSKFHEKVGMTIRNYISGRRLAKATLELRDTKNRIIDIAVKYGFSSQEAFTRTFVSMYGCTPAIYRKNPIPLAIPIKREVCFPDPLRKGENDMSENALRDANVRVEFLPSHKYIGIWDIDTDDYCSFWSRHDCDKTCGVIDSMSHVSHRIVTGHTAGWFWENGKRGYFYGFGVPDDYDGIIPEGFEMREIPASYYLVFFHPPYDYLKDNGEVMSRVEELAWNFDPATMGWKWNEEACNDYQRHYPEGIGYEILRPVK